MCKTQIALFRESRRSLSLSLRLINQKNKYYNNKY